MSSPPEAEGGSEAAFLLVPERSAVAIGGQEIVLTSTQYRLLAVLLSYPGRAFRREELVALGIGKEVGQQTVDSHIKAIRRQLGPQGARIETVRGIGYRFRGPAG
jgi:two-component system, OmpR family, phosphate regulon response regulator PhoB